MQRIQIILMFQEADYSLYRLVSLEEREDSSDGIYYTGVIEDELDAQLDELVETYNADPDTVDGVTVDDVRYSLTEGVVEATIMEGRVALSLSGSDGEPIVVTANDRATLVKGRGSFRLDHLDASVIAQWIDGALVFRETWLSDIAGRLERYYDVSVRLADKQLGSMVYTATFDKDTPIEKILELLAFTSPIEYAIDGKQIVIKLKQQ